MEFGNSEDRKKAKGNSGEAEVVPLLDLLEQNLLHKIGIDPQRYYLNTIRNNNHIAIAWDNRQLVEWERTRYVAYSNFATTFGFNGKPMFRKMNKPSDLFKLPSDVHHKEKALEGEAANDFMKTLVKPK